MINLLSRAISLPQPIDSFDLTSFDRKRLAAELGLDDVWVFEGIPIRNRPDGESVYRFNAKIGAFGLQSLCTPLSTLRG